MTKAQTLENFVSKSRELLQDMEACLAQMEQSPDNIALINGLYRAAQSIKGSAGLFGLQLVLEAEAAGRQGALRRTSHQQTPSSAKPDGFFSDLASMAKTQHKVGETL